MSSLIPAAQYLRMSTEDQQYSIDNQRTRIREYALRNGFDIVKTYEDPGKSGVIIKHRKGLSALLKSVVSGEAEFAAVLVYDVSRWGRFQNPDEAAHYEFLCTNSGIPLHYCAEQFPNDCTASSSLMKALKRSMAAEFSRELGDKVFRGKTTLVKLGYWAGGPPGYGFRRLMVSAEGKPKQVLKPGERKSLTTDRVVLIPGPPQELQGVKAIFEMAAAGNGPSVIARELNRRGITHGGRPWLHQSVKAIVTHPKYMGCNTWNRCSQRLRGPRTNVAPQLWVRKPLAFKPLVDQATFESAQAGLPVPKQWSRKEIIKKVKGLLKRKGRISEDIIRAARGMPAPPTIYHHFGSYQTLYDSVGYRPDTEDFHKYNQISRSMLLRRTLVKKIKEMFPQNIIVTHLPRCQRSMLLVDRSFMVSILLCRSKCKHGKHVWIMEPTERERNFITLLCTMNSSHDRVLDYYVVPRMAGQHMLHRKVSWLRQGVRLSRLSDFYAAVKKMYARRSSQGTISEYLQEL